MPASLFSAQAHICKRELLSSAVFFFSATLMPGDPAVLKGVPLSLNTADLLNAVAMKLHPFWPNNIETWLVQSESLFRMNGVTASQTKFDYVVQSMSQSDAVKVL